MIISSRSEPGSPVAVVEVRLVFPENLRNRTGDDDGGGLIETDTQQLRKTGNQAFHVGQAVALAEMLVNRRAGKKAKALLVALRHGIEISQRITSNHIG